MHATKGIKEEFDDNDCKIPNGLSGNKPDQYLNAYSDFDTDSNDETSAEHGQKQMFSITRYYDDNSDINGDKARRCQYRRHVESSSKEKSSSTCEPCDQREWKARVIPKLIWMHRKATELGKIQTIRSTNVQRKSTKKNIIQERKRTETDIGATKRENVRR